MSGRDVVSSVSQPPHEPALVECPWLGPPCCEAPTQLTSVTQKSWLMRSGSGRTAGGCVLPRPNASREEVTSSGMPLATLLACSHPLSASFLTEPRVADPPLKQETSESAECWKTVHASPGKEPRGSLRLQGRKAAALYSEDQGSLQGPGRLSGCRAFDETPSRLTADPSSWPTSGQNEQKGERAGFLVSSTPHPMETLCQPDPSCSLRPDSASSLAQPEAKAAGRGAGIHSHATRTTAPQPAVSGVREDKGQTLRDQGHGWSPTLTTPAKGTAAALRALSLCGHPSPALSSLLFLSPTLSLPVAPRGPPQCCWDPGTSYH